MEKVFTVEVKVSDPMNGRKASYSSLSGDRFHRTDKSEKDYKALLKMNHSNLRVIQSGAAPRKIRANDFRLTLK